MIAGSVQGLVAGARFVQFAAGSTILGVPLVALMAPVRGAYAGPLRSATLVGAGALALASAVAMVGQTATMAGDMASALQPATMNFVLSGTAFGHAIIARLLLAIAVLGCGLMLQARPALWWTAGGLGVLAMASFAWTGHGAADDAMPGLIHSLADVLHLICAGVWLGALLAFTLLLKPAAASAEGRSTLLAGLEAFSGIGPALVAVLALSGLVNSWFLVGITHLSALVTTLYGQLLLLKLALFAGMLGLAAINRYRLTPTLADGEPERAMGPLTRSLLLENGLGVGVLLVLSVLGMLAPVSAQ